MSGKMSVELGSVQLTLLLPLWGRAIETRKQKPLLRDETAEEIISKIDYDFSRMALNVQDVTQFEWICRSIHIDRTIKEFLRVHPEASIVNAGCGLDTTFDRVDNGKLMWYELDLPDVIELRRRFIPETPRRKFISSSFLDESWFPEIRAGNGVLFMAAGVLYYFNEQEVKQIFRSLASFFPDSDFIFDAASPVGLKAANEQLIKKVGLDEKSFMKWALPDASEIRQWDIKLKSAEQYLMYKGMKKGLSVKNKIISSLADHYKMMYMVHLKF
ncbi:MAG: class I SAM-dependent methyltransferase [Ignavibacteria bacterium]|jgi:O-methyltransferase involved in polyketide biosynthesis|nr:class I SAM-dependent methyltransferase [Ignavibacteria bacterium]MCU7502866.1 class I SAM-dependent methyltransferase [Ignavibacteria bacterium]MCU7515640.1 class I SAM-dependent methyltransferase [Ignavibacteria bacterium]